MHKKKPPWSSFSIMIVRMKGLEPPRLTTPDPKSGAATNYATSAFGNGGAKVQLFSGSQNVLQLLFECVNCRLVIRLFGNFGNKLGVQNGAILIENNYCAGK